MLELTLYVPSTPPSWYYQPVLLVTLPHVPFLFLLNQSGILYLHTSVLLIISLHLSAIFNHTFASQLSRPSPAPLIRSLQYWRCINLVICIYDVKNDAITPNMKRISGFETKMSWFCATHSNGSLFDNIMNRSSEVSSTFCEQRSSSALLEQ